MSSFEMFKERLPSKEKFCSSLTGKTISDKDYKHVLKIWNTFKMKTMKDYHYLYSKCDVLLLGDVLENFRVGSLKNYEWSQIIIWLRKF